MTNPDECQQRIDEIREYLSPDDCEPINYEHRLDMLWLCDEVTDLQQQLAAAQDRSKAYEEVMADTGRDLMETRDQLRAEREVRNRVASATLLYDQELEQARHLLEQLKNDATRCPNRRLHAKVLHELRLTPPTPDATEGMDG